MISITIRRALLLPLLCLFSFAQAETIVLTKTIHPTQLQDTLFVTTILGNIAIEPHEKETLEIKATIEGPAKFIENMNINCEATSQTISILPMREQTDQIKVSYTILIPPCIIYGCLSSTKLGLIIVNSTLNAFAIESNLFLFDRSNKLFSSEPFL